MVVYQERTEKKKEKKRRVETPPPNGSCQNVLLEVDSACSRGCKMREGMDEERDVVGVYDGAGWCGKWSEYDTYIVRSSEWWSGMDVQSYDR